MKNVRFPIQKETLCMTTILLLRKMQLQALLTNGFCGQIILILMKKYTRVLYPWKSQ